MFLIFLSISSNAQEIRKNDEHAKENSNSFFDGFYFGTTLGTQNIYGGAFIDNLDLLAQKSGFVLEFSTGYRKQFFENRFLIGLEVHFGFTDGDLVETDPRFQFDVFYQNNTQSGFGLISGGVIRRNRNILIFGYANLTSRNFDVEITEPNGTIYTQQDSERPLRYGIGVEIHIKIKFSVRASIGGLKADFGEKVTSQDVEDKMDINIGLGYQF